MVNLRFFWNYVDERYLILHKRKQGHLPPWTEDSILRKYKFTNVFRRDDPGTQFVLNKIIPFYTEDIQNLLFNIILYRLFNKIETYELIGGQNHKKFDKLEIRHALEETRHPVFTNAFIVSPYNFLKEEGTKIARVVKLLELIAKDIPIVTEKIIRNRASEVTYSVLKSLPGIGEFLAYQICVDLGYYSHEFYDENKHVVAGKGALNGLNFLFPNSFKRHSTYLIKFLVDTQSYWLRRLSQSNSPLIRDYGYKPLNLMAVENCLCEISKYLKALYGLGRPRVRYKIKY